ncbi:MAG: ubiquinol-cytochrome c reductase iron-sulfur subunit [Dehalococcoidia bacterium]
MTNQPQGDASGSWQQALATRRTQLAGGATVPSTAAARRLPDISRRRFIVLNFWAGLGTVLAGSVGLLVDYLYPRGVTGFGGPVPAGKVTELAKGGAPKEFPIGQFWLVNLDPAETRAGGSGGGEGIIALWRKCPHLGCSVPWRPGFTFNDDQGWFRCPCHGSTYTKAGVRVFGPAPRSMDTMAVEIDGSGNIVVQTGQRTPGGPDNPQRAKKV